MSHLFSESLALYGYSVSLSADGDTLAVGSPSWIEREECLRDGKVWIYRFIENAWRDFGIPIVGERASAAGWSVSLSSDGNTVAVGAPEAGTGCVGDGHSNLSRRGSVEVYEWTGTQLNHDYLQSTYWTLRQQFMATLPLSEWVSRCRSPEMHNGANRHWRERDCGSRVR